MRKGVLVLNCGTLASYEINTFLKNNEEFKIYGSSTTDNHGKYIYENYIDDIPSMNDDNFFEVLNENIKKYNIKFIMPQHEDLALFCQKNSDKIDAVVVASSYDTSLCARYKSELYKRFKDYDFCPKIYGKDDTPTYPVFVKMDNDQGGRHAFIALDKKDLDFYLSKYDNMLVCEFLPGEEVTIDCFTDKNGKLLLCLPREAKRMLAGIDVRALSLSRAEEINNIAKVLNDNLNFRGYWFFQVKKSQRGIFKLLEISTRFAGSFDHTRGLDINLPYLALKDFDGQDVASLIQKNELIVESDKQFYTRYNLKDAQGKNITYDRILVDFESTLKKSVNPLLMMYIYQSINKNISIELLTHDKNEAKETLKKEKISADIFKFIDDDEVSGENAILITNDNTLKNKCENIYHFSENNIDALLDWKG